MTHDNIDRGAINKSSGESTVEYGNRAVVSSIILLLKNRFTDRHENAPL